MSTEIEIVQKFEVYKKQANDFAAKLSTLKVTDENSEAIVTQRLSEAKELIKAVEGKRTELKAPYLDAGRQIDKIAKELVEQLNLAYEDIRKVLLAWKQEQEKKRKEEIAQLEEGKKKVDKYYQDAIAEINQAKAPVDLSAVFVKYVKDFPGADVWGAHTEYANHILAEIKAAGGAKLKAIKEGVSIVAEVREVAVPENIEEKAIQLEVSKPSNMRKVWKFEMVEKMQVPLDWLILDDKKVKEFMAQAKEAGHLKEGENFMFNGVKFYQEDQLVVK